MLLFFQIEFQILINLVSTFIKPHHPDEDKNNIENNARLRIGDGAYWGFCEEKSWSKALSYYVKILENSKNTHPNILLGQKEE